MLPATLQFLIAMIACAINERMQRKLDYTQEEVRVLKEILAALTGNGRISFTADHRRRLAVVGKPPVRAERGKPARGRITIRAAQEADFVYLTFEDDGGGIDRQAIRHASQASGHPAASGELDDEVLLNTIFEAGFSTRAQSDALSGRGMGMNIVKSAVARMGGEVKVESQAGSFTRFKLTLPLAGAITQGLLFKIGGQVYAVPAAHVIEVLPIGHNVLTGTAQSSSSSGELPALGGVNLPILRLHALLGLELPPGRRAAALHVRYAGRNFLITCD